MRRKKYYKDLALCKKEKKKILSEELVESMALTKEEMEKNYYKGMTWEEAFENSSLYKKATIFYNSGNRIKDSRNSNRRRRGRMGRNQSA